MNKFSQEKKSQINSEGEKGHSRYRSRREKVVGEEEQRQGR